MAQVPGVRQQQEDCSGRCNPGEPQEGGAFPESLALPLPGVPSTAARKQESADQVGLFPQTLPPAQRLVGLRVRLPSPPHTTPHDRSGRDRCTSTLASVVSDREASREPCLGSEPAEVMVCPCLRILASDSGSVPSGGHRQPAEGGQKLELLLQEAESGRVKGIPILGTVVGADPGPEACHVSGTPVASETSENEAWMAVTFCFLKPRGREGDDVQNVRGSLRVGSRN